MLQYIVFCILVVALSAQHHHHGHQDFVCRSVEHLDCSSYDKELECGTDNVTYDNRCFFNRAHCKDDKLHIAHKGQCGVPTTDPHGTTGQQAQWAFFCTHLAGEHCDPGLDLICASNAVTYDNLCEYEKAMCMHSGLKITSYGACPSATS